MYYNVCTYNISQILDRITFTNTNISGDFKNPHLNVILKSPVLENIVNMDMVCIVHILLPVYFIF